MNQEASPQTASEVVHPEIQNNSSLEAVDANQSGQPTPTEPDVEPSQSLESKSNSTQ